MKGRKSIPIKLVDNKKHGMTKKELEARQGSEPMLKIKKITCPMHLTKEAKKEWKRIIKLYEELEIPILNNLDRNAIEVYCETLVTYRKAVEKIRYEGEIITTIRGMKVQNPWMNVIQKCTLDLKRYGEILLLDPQSRARIGTAQAAINKAKTDDDPMEELLKKGYR